MIDIKNGDKVLCIKDFFPGKDESPYLVDNFYEIQTVFNSIITLINFENITSSGSVKQINFFTYEEFGQFFLTPAKYRERQINSILDD